MTTPINVNSASTNDLLSLQGVGGVIAQEIIKKREECGRCLTPENIKSIPKIPATTWQPCFEEAQIIFASAARSSGSSHNSSAFKLSERARDNSRKEIEAEMEREFKAKLEAETNRLTTQMEAQIRAVAQNLSTENQELQQDLSGIRKEAMELAKESTAKGIKLLEMQGEVEEKEKEYVAKLQKREEYATEVELCSVYYEEELWGTQMRMKEIYEEALQKKGFAPMAQGVTSEIVKAEWLISPKGGENRPSGCFNRTQG